MKTLSAAISLILLLVILGCDEAPVFPGNGPAVPHNPTPETGAGGQSLSLTLGWECSSPDERSLTYDVYIGRESSPPLEAVGVAQPSYDVDNLVPNRRYYWRVVARDDRGLVQDGPIWYFDTVSSVWEQYASPTGQNLNGVAVSGNTGRAVGDAGTLLAFADGQWSEVATGLADNLNDVAWDGATGYCVGDNGVILKLTSAGWAAESSPTVETLRAVALDGEGSAWAAGGAGTVLRLANGVWSEISVPGASGYALYDVAVNGAGEVLIAANNSTVFYWDGEGWSKETVSPGDIQIISDITSAAYLATGTLPGFWVGNALGDIIYRDVAADSTVTWVSYGTPCSASVNALDFEGGGFGMAAYATGKVSRFDGSGWATAEGIASTDLNGVAYLSAGEGWAVGDGGVIYHYRPVE